MAVTTQDSRSRPAKRQSRRNSKERAPFLPPEAAAFVRRRLAEVCGLVLIGTSLGTNPGDYDNYVNTITLPDQIVGVGAVLMFLAELDGMDAPRPGAFSRTTGE